MPGIAAYVYTKSGNLSSYGAVMQGVGPGAGVALQFPPVWGRQKRFSESGQWSVRSKVGQILMKRVVSVSGGLMHL